MSFRAYMLYLKKKKKVLDQLNHLVRKQTQKRVPLFSLLRLEKQIKKLCMATMSVSLSSFTQGKMKSQTVL